MTRAARRKRPRQCTVCKGRRYEIDNYTYPGMVKITCRCCGSHTGYCPSWEFARLAWATGDVE